AALDVFGKPYAALDGAQQHSLQYDLKMDYRTNRYDAVTDTLTVSDRRARAIEQTAAYYSSLFSAEPELRSTRVSVAMKENTLPDAERRERLSEFFFWTAWAAATERPDSAATYTNNSPHEPLIDNKPTAENIIWSIVSVILLVAGIGGLIWAWEFLRKEGEHDPAARANDPISLVSLTPSHRAL